MKLRTTDISIPHDRVWLNGELAHAPGVRALVAILRPAGSPFAQSRELQVAHILHEAGFATLLINLLTSHEESRDPDARYNVPLLANRVLAIGEWVQHQPPLIGLAIGLTASGTASGAAIRAAWKAPERFGAIVCRGGRPDLAGLQPLNSLSVPTRLIVGGADPHVGMMRQAYEHLHAGHDWRLLDGITEQFAQSGAMEQFAKLAAEWLSEKLPAPQSDEETGAHEPPTVLRNEEAGADPL